jgi:hypothetical protein
MNEYTKIIEISLYLNRIEFPVLSGTVCKRNLWYSTTLILNFFKKMFRGVFRLCWKYLGCLTGTDNTRLYSNLNPLVSMGI